MSYIIKRGIIAYLPRLNKTTTWTCDDAEKEVVEEAAKGHGQGREGVEVGNGN